MICEALRCRYEIYGREVEGYLSFSYAPSAEHTREIRKARGIDFAFVGRDLKNKL